MSAARIAELEAELETTRDQVERLTRDLAEAEEHQLPPSIYQKGWVLNLTGCPDLGETYVNPPDEVAALLKQLLDPKPIIDCKEHDRIHLVCERAIQVAKLANSLLRNWGLRRWALINPPVWMASQLEVQLQGKDIQTLYPLDPDEMEQASGKLSLIRVWPGGR
jgi:hypothetical protein